MSETSLGAGMGDDDDDEDMDDVEDVEDVDDNDDADEAAEGKKDGELDNGNNIEMIDKKEIVDKKMDDKNGDNSQINGKEPEESKTEEVAK